MSIEKFDRHQLYGVLPTEAEGIDSLAWLALDMRWSWNRAADELWKQLDPELWEHTHSPWIVLQTVSRDRLEGKLADPAFQEKIREIMALKEQEGAKPGWFHQKYPESPLTTVAYFSMEFMLSEDLPIYVGGLGNVAGDQLKSAGDLGVPVIGVGLLYQQGYFRQEIDQNGSQQALYPYNDPGQLPITPLRLPNGEWVRIQISLAGRPVWLRAWQAQVGRVKLYLLDSNDAANLPAHRAITSEVYGGGPDLRIQQEILLGIGGWKLLRALGIRPEVCHMNEGHAAFLVLERAGDLMKETGISFETALAVVRAGNLFTTHTAVAAGFDHFSPSLMWQFFCEYAREEIKIEFNDLMALGRQDPFNTSEPFNMAYLAIRGSGAVNGVSRLHGVVSRDLFDDLFPRWPKAEVPVGYVTNGVHTPTWEGEYADKIWAESCGKDRWEGSLETLEQGIQQLPDETLWQLRNNCRESLIKYTRQRLGTQAFDPNVLTLSFARRFVAYKRPSLLLHDEERFIRLLKNAQYPVQLIIAGKAPPSDEGGNALIRQWVQFIQRHNLHDRVVFLSDYDMLLAGQLVEGADVWINTPRRPWEACGTSGMKVLVNGGVNLSELDGWWPEAYKPEIGWALGDGQEHGDDPGWDAAEAEALYDLLEKQVIPEFYERNDKGLPLRWIERMRKSMATLTPQFSANRAVREYTEKYYLPAAANYVKRAAEKGAVGLRIIDARHDLRQKWNALAFGDVKTGVTDDGYLFEVGVLLNGISPGNVLVELYADGLNGGAPERIKMEAGLPADEATASGEGLGNGGNGIAGGGDGKERYHARVKTTRAAGDYTVRIMPLYEGVAVPLEDNLIKWQH